jgi:hypothetical protein
MKGRTIDRLLAIYISAYAAHVRAGCNWLDARRCGRSACDDFTAYIRQFDEAGEADDDAG